MIRASHPRERSATQIDERPLRHDERSLRSDERRPVSEQNLEGLRGAPPEGLVSALGDQLLADATRGRPLLGETSMTARFATGLRIPQTVAAQSRRTDTTIRQPRRSTVRPPARPAAGALGASGPQAGVEGGATAPLILFTTQTTNGPCANQYQPTGRQPRRRRSGGLRGAVRESAVPAARDPPPRRSERRRRAAPPRPLGRPAIRGPRGAP